MAGGRPALGTRATDSVRVMSGIERRPAPPAVLSIVTVVVGVMFALPGALVLWTFMKDYQKQRLLSFLDPAADPLGTGYQLQQSQITVSSGGFFGRGLTNGLAGQNLPVGSTDFVFARVSEELGFLGGMLVLANIVKGNEGCKLNILAALFATSRYLFAINNIFVGSSKPSSRA